MDITVPNGFVVGGPHDGEQHGRYDFNDGAVLTLSGERYTLRLEGSSYVWVYSPGRENHPRNPPTAKASAE